MSIDPLAGTSSSSGIYSATTTTRVPKQSLDSEAFMSLLVTQLQNQDPSSPMDTNEMISQTTQLAEMEQLTDMNTTSTESFALQMRIAASTLIGQQVSYADADGNTVTAAATSVSFSGPVPTVTVGGKEIPLDSISGVAAPTTEQP